MVTCWRGDGEVAKTCVVLGQGLARCVELEDGASQSEPVLVDAAADLQELFVGKTDRLLIERAARVDVAAEQPDVKVRLRELHVDSPVR